MNTVLKFAAAAFIGSMMLAAPASAAPIVVAGACSGVSGLTELGGTTPGNFACTKFDSNLGTLLSMSLTITGGITGTIALTNDGAQGPQFRGTTQTEFFVAPLAGFAFTSPMFTASYSTGFIVQPTGTTVYGVFNDTDQQAGVNNSNFAAYQASGGGLFPITVTTLTSLICNTGGGNGGCSQVTTADASALVSYTYDDGVITTPEPASMALLGAGMLALGAIRRRRS